MRQARFSRWGLAVLAWLPFAALAADPKPWQLNMGRGVTASAQNAYEAHMLAFWVCLAIGAGAWLPALRSDPGPHRLPPVVAHAPYHGFTPALAPAGNTFGQTYRVPNQHTLYPQGYLLETTVTPASLAPRPLSAFVTQR